MSEDILERLKKWSSSDARLTIFQLETLLSAITEIELLRLHAGAVTRGESYDDLKRRAGPLHRD